MFTAESCPDRHSYEQLLAGVYPPEDQLEQVAAHLERCPRCAETLRELARADTFAEGATKTLPPGGEEDVVARLVERLGRLTPSAATGDAAPTECGIEATDDLSALLTPPQAEGEMGRLGPYRVLGVIGRGGMGVVLRAEDPRLGRVVALKVMRPELTASAEARRRFATEARAMAAVEHDHITPVYHVGEERGVPFFLMPLLRGESLEARLRRTGKLPVAEAVRIAREVAEGLAAAHARGLIHRDVKPANVWLEGEPGEAATGGRVKLLDFGLARPVQADARLTQSGALLGTPAYMAPEQARGEAVDGRCDLFSLGCVLYQMVTGELAFHGKDALSTLLAVTTAYPPPPRELAPEVPPALNNLVLRLLAKNLPDRPASAGAVARELGALERSPAPATAPAAGRPRPASRRRRWVIVAVAAALLGVVGGPIAYQVIRVKDKDGNVIAEVKVPPGGSYEAVDKPQGPSGHHAESVPEALPPLPAGEPLGPLALVARPAKLDGVRSWTIETARPRGGVGPAHLSPDGSRLAVVCEDGTLRIYDAATGRLERALLAPARVMCGNWGPDSASWSPDSSRLAAGYEDRTCRVWDVRTGRLVYEVPSQGALFCVAWSPDGKTIAGRIPGFSRFWDAETGSPIRPPEEFNDVGYLVWSPDGKVLAVIGTEDDERVVWLCEFPSCKRLHTLRHGIDSISPPAWSPDGKTLVTGETKKQEFRVWDAATGRLIRTVKHGGNWLNNPAAFSPDGKTLALSLNVGGSIYVNLYDAATGQRLRLTGPWGQGELRSLGWSPDGKTLTVAEQGGEQGQVVTVDARTGRALRAIKAPGPVWDLAWSPDGNRVITAAHWTVWDVESGTLLRDLGSMPHAGQPGQLAYSPDGSALAAVTMDAAIRIYQAETGQTLRWLGVPAGSSWRTAWSPDGKTLASGGGDKTVRLWDAASGKLLRSLEGHERPVHRVAWSPGGRVLASGDEQEVRLWDVASGKALRTLPRPGSAALAWSPDGKCLACGNYRPADNVDPNVWVWDGESGKLLSSLPGQFLDWSADGRTVATVSGTTVRTWDVRSGRVLRSWESRPSRLSQWGLAASPDHRTWASNLAAAAIRLWHSDSGRPGLTLVPLGDGAGFALSPDGHYRGSPGVEKELVYVVQTDKGQDVLTPEEFARRYGWKNDPNRVRLLAR